MTLKFNMWLCVCEYYQDGSNYDPGLTLAYFIPGSNLVTYAFALAKVINYVLFGNYCSHRPQSWFKQSNK